VPGYELRPLRRDDLPALLEILLAEAAEAGVESSASLPQLLREWEDPWSPPETDSLCACDAATGALVGVARAYTKPEPAVRDAFSFLSLALRPGAAPSGLAEALLDWAERTGRARLAGTAGPLPGVLRIPCDRKEESRAALFERRGFAARRIYRRMRRALAEPIPEPELPEGLRALPYAPSYRDALREAFNETFSDHWGFEPVTEEDWRLFFIDTEEFRPDLSWLALAGEEIAGYSINGVNEAECERLGERRAWISQLGVRRPWRKRGVATALLRLSMRSFRDAGLEAAVLGVDSENLTGAVAIYERAGFRAFREIRLFEKAVSAEGARPG